MDPFKMSLDMSSALGGKSRVKKPTDYHPDSFLGSVSPTPESYQSPVPIIYMQDKYPNCGGHAPAPAANILFGDITSPKYMWDEIKQIDKLNSEDGTSLDAIMFSWKNKGICFLSMLPDTLGNSLAEYTNPKNITALMEADGATRRISNYAFLDNPTMQQIKDKIYQFKTVILLVKCGDGWWKNKQGQNSWAETDILPLRLGNLVDGHFICATGFDKDYIYFANSWSTQWGRQGIGYFDESYVSNVREMGIPIVSTPISPTVPTYQFKSDIRYGDYSADVHALQVKLGVPVSLTITLGKYGWLTLLAVVKYEITHHLPITSVVTQQMRDLLNNS